MALTDNIVGCWSPSVRGSGLLLPDLSGRGNHGTLTNMAGDDWVGASVRGVGGKVLDFDGSNDWIDIGTNQLLRFEATSWTIGLWAKPVLRSFYQSIMANDSNVSQNPLYEIGVNPENKLYFYDNSSLILGATMTSNWQFVAVVGEIVGLTQTVRLWQDAINTGALTGIGIFSTSRGQKVRIAVDAEAGPGQSGFFAGQIGEVSMWRRNLTATEIAELYRRGNGAIGRELTGQTRRRVYGFVPGTGARRRRILTGMV